MKSDYTKINQAKIELTSWLDKHGGKIDIYHVGTVLESIGNVLQSVPGAIWKDGSDAKQELENFLSVVQKISTSLLEGYDKFYDSLSDLYDKHYEMFLRVEKAHERIIKKVESLPKIPDINIPYNIDKLIELAEKFQGLDEATWNRVVDLAKAFANNR